MPFHLPIYSWIPCFPRRQYYGRFPEAFRSVFSICVEYCCKNFVPRRVNGAQVNPGSNQQDARGCCRMISQAGCLSSFFVFFVPALITVPLLDPEPCAATRAQTRPYKVPSRIVSPPRNGVSSGGHQGGRTRRGQQTKARNSGRVVTCCARVALASLRQCLSRRTASWVWMLLASK